MAGELTTDLTVLVLAVLLAFVQLTLYSVAGNLAFGPRYTLGPRDASPDWASAPITARLRRAYENLLETLPLFAIAVLVAHVSGTASAVTAVASQVYLGARIVYIPCYVSGIPVLRSVVWSVAALAILVILGEILV